MKTKIYLLLIMLLTMASPAFAYYTIDGSVADWGIDLTNPAAWNAGYLDSNTPTGGNDIDYVTEDNADINSGTIYVGPGYSTGNLYDAEAFYIDNDNQNLYFALITGTPPAGVEFPAGDIFFDVGVYQDPNSAQYSVSKYQYAVDILTGQFYQTQSWTDVVYPQHAASNPWKIGDTKILLGDIDFVFSELQNSHYVIEGKIPLSMLSLYGKDAAKVWASWTMLCGNDHLKLMADVTHAVPEPSTVALMSMGLVGAYYRRRNK